ncbi:fibronectin type III-like domain-contianing protein [Paenibacillus sp. OVF10]|nr:fibronectin type III-like domain-contianing protein [Paenibacillus sp. OVF10]
MLAGFAKTKELIPGGKQSVEIEINFKTIASYDDAGITGCRSAWVLEAGSYIFHVGDHVRDAKSCGSIAIDKLQVLEQLQESMAPVVAFERMRCASDGSLIYEPVPIRTIEPKTRRVKLFQMKFLILEIKDISLQMSNRIWSAWKIILLNFRMKIYVVLCVVKA